MRMLLIRILAPNFVSSGSSYVSVFILIMSILYLVFLFLFLWVGVSRAYSQVESTPLANET